MGLLGVEGVGFWTPPVRFWTPWLHRLGWRGRWVRPADGVRVEAGRADRCWRWALRTGVGGGRAAGAAPKRLSRQTNRASGPERQGCPEGRRLNARREGSDSLK